jgi:hypothetical protein
MGLQILDFRFWILDLATWPHPIFFGPKLYGCFRARMVLMDATVIASSSLASFLMASARPGAITPALTSNSIQ